MLTYENDIKPIKITAREANKQSLGAEEYLNTLKDVYTTIQENIDDGYTDAHFFYNTLGFADRVYRELLAQDYNLSLGKEGDHYHLTVDWSDVDLDPNKKYILQLDEAETTAGAHYYAVRDSDKWKIAVAYNPSELEAFRFTVTAQDIEEAPEWVKAIEAVEV